MSKFSVSRGAPVAAVVVAALLASTAAFAQPMGGFGPGRAPAGVEGHRTMMHMRGPMGSGGAGFGMNQHIDGRIAFLKAELKITGAQETQWAAVEKAMRDQSAAMTKLHEEFRAERDKVRAERDKTKPEGDKAERRQALTAPEVLALREKATEARTKAMTVRAEGQKQFATAFTALYERLSDDQKKTADGLLARGGHHFARFHR